MEGSLSGVRTVRPGVDLLKHVDSQPRLETIYHQNINRNLMEQRTVWKYFQRSIVYLYTKYTIPYIFFFNVSTFQKSGGPCQTCPGSCGKYRYIAGIFEINNVRFKTCNFCVFELDTYI